MLLVGRFKTRREINLWQPTRKNMQRRKRRGASAWGEKEADVAGCGDGVRPVVVVGCRGAS